MNLVADEGVERSVVDALRKDGHEVSYLAELAPGTGDEEILSLANTRQAPLTTTDKDFGELVFRQRRQNCGVVLLRLAGLSNISKGESVAMAFRLHGQEMLSRFTVILPGRIRIRHKI
jgi:predicted nuclease of predicted toxin-antitoxin system